MIRRIAAALIVFAAMGSGALAETKITLIFTNSGDAGNVVIVDDICHQDAYNGHFASKDVEILTEAFCVEDAGTLKTNITIAIDGTLMHELKDVVANSTVDISTGTITAP